MRDRADRIGGRDTFMRLMDQNGFRINPKPIEDKVYDKSVVTKGLKVLERLAEIGPWHEGLSPKNRRECASPSGVYKHCPAFAEPTTQTGTSTAPTSMQKHDKLRRDYLQSLKALLTAKEQVAELEQVARSFGLRLVKVDHEPEPTPAAPQPKGKAKKGPKPAGKLSKLQWTMSDAGNATAPAGNGEEYVVHQGWLGLMEKAVFFIDRRPLDWKVDDDRIQLGHAPTMAKGKAIAKKDFAAQC